jgi:hypothetical protein
MRALCLVALAVGAFGCDDDTAGRVAVNVTATLNGCTTSDGGASCG